MSTALAFRRSLLACSLVIVAGACGGGDAVAPKLPQPQPQTQQPGPPALLSVVSGDAQTAQRGTVLPAKLSLLVKDAAGTALSGVTVTFSVDSGGGTLSVTTAVTGSNGVAIGGDWTLGSAIGTQVVSARVNALAPLKFRAQALGPEVQTLIDKRSVPPTGGQLKFTKPGDPLDGFAITIPPRSYPTATEWTVIADSTSHATLPADFSQVGPMLVINNAQGYADSAMTLTMPMSVSSTDALVPFYYDSVSRTFEPIPLVGRTATSASLGTRHFTRDMMAIPGNTSLNALRSSIAAGFGVVKIVWVKTPKLKLVGTFASEFRPTVDNWEFENYGDYVSPTGDCEGMSITAMYYHFFHKLAGEAPLYHRFDLTLPNILDNVQGIRWAGSVQGDYDNRWDAGINQLVSLVDQGVANGAKTEDLTSTWILLTIKLTKQPVLLALRQTSGGHAVVAYSATSTGSRTDVAFSDPNFATTGRTMTFESGKLSPIAMSLSTGGASRSYDRAYALAVTAEVPLPQLHSRYAEFKAKTAGSDRYPAHYRAEYFDNITESWVELGATLNTTDPSLRFQHICTDCPYSPVISPAHAHVIELWNGAGSAKLEAQSIENVEGTTKYYYKLLAYPPSDHSNAGFVDAMPFTVTYHPFKINYLGTQFFVGDEIAFAAVAGDLADAGSRYVWKVYDSTAAVTGTEKFTHKFMQLGFNDVEVKLINGAGKVVARARTEIFISARVSISPPMPRASSGNPITLTAIVEATIPADMSSSITYVWTFAKPGETKTFTTSVPTFTGSFNEGTYAASVKVMYVEFTEVGRSPSVPLVVKAWPGAWRLTSLTLQSTVPIGSGFPPRWVAGYQTMLGLLERAVKTPGDAMIFLDDGDLWKEHAVYFQIAPAGQGANATYWVPNSFITLLARDASIQFSHYTTTGTIRTGSIDGAGYVETLDVAMLNTIQSTKTATQMTGTIKIAPYSFGGDRVYKFTAILVTP